MNVQPQQPTGRPGSEPARHDRTPSGVGPAGAAAADEADGLSLASIVEAIWANKWLLLAMVALGVGYSAWQVSQETPLYTARAQVVIEPRQSAPIELNTIAPQIGIDYLTLNTELEVLRSTDVMAGTVEALSLEQDPEFNPRLRSPSGWLASLGLGGAADDGDAAPDPEVSTLPLDQQQAAATGILRSKVSVGMEQNSLIFNISATTDDPAKSAEIANTIADVYVAGQRDAKFEALQEAMAWLGDRVVELKEQLETAEAAVEDFAADATLVNAETLSGSAQRLKSMRARQAELADSAERLQRRIDELTALRANADFAGLQDVEDARLGALAREAAGASSDDAARARFDAALERHLSALRANAENAADQAAAAARSVEDLQESFDAQAADAVALRQLRREAEATRLLYESFLGRLKEISVQQGVQQADSRILTSATPPGGPSHPNVQRSLTKGAAVGLVLGFLLISVRNVLRTSVRTPEELGQAGGLTVLGVIPDDRGRRPEALLERICAKPSSAFAEAVRNLRTAVQLSNVDVTPRVVVVTSSVPDEGKSILAAALARTSAMAGKKVLLIDADLRRRALRDYFKVEADAEAGLVSLLSGQHTFAEIVFRDKATGMDLLPADDTAVTPVDFFGSRKFTDFLTAARQSYDLVVIDTPPVLAVPDTRVIAQHADAVIYAVRWNSTARRMIRAGIDLLHQVNVRVTGTCLTRVDPRRMDRYGYYGYGYGTRGRKLQKYYTG